MRSTVLALILILMACRSVSVPPGDRPFAAGDEGAGITGCFAEQGESGPEPSRPAFLSIWLWPERPRDVAITAVSIETTAEGSLIVRALAGGAVLRERIIPAPARRDGLFRLAGGTWFPPFTSESDELPPMVGAHSDKTELGSDTAGDLELRQSGWAVGLVFLVIPVVFTYDEQVRFARVLCP